MHRYEDVLLVSSPPMRACMHLSIVIFSSPKLPGDDQVARKLVNWGQRVVSVVVGMHVQSERATRHRAGRRTVIEVSHGYMVCAATMLELR